MSNTVESTSCGVLKKSIITTCKDKYTAERRPTEPIKVLSDRKKGRLLLLEEELDVEVKASVETILSSAGL